MIRDFDENHYAIRIGSLVLHNIGQLLPHQLSAGHFNNRDFIYPVRTTTKQNFDSRTLYTVYIYCYK